MIQWNIATLFWKVQKFIPPPNLKIILEFQAKQTQTSKPKWSKKVLPRNNYHIPFQDRKTSKKFYLVPPMLSEINQLVVAYFTKRF